MFLVYFDFSGQKYSHVFMYILQELKRIIQLHSNSYLIMDFEYKYMRRSDLEKCSRRGGPRDNCVCRGGGPRPILNNENPCMKYASVVTQINIRDNVLYTRFCYHTKGFALDKVI